MDVVVEPLSSYPQAVPTVAEWHFREWGHTDPGGSLEAWTAGLARQAGADRVPGTLIALADGIPVAVVCLVAQDMPGYGPAAGLSPLDQGPVRDPVSAPPGGRRPSRAAVRGLGCFPRPQGALSLHRARLGCPGPL